MRVSLRCMGTGTAVPSVNKEACVCVCVCVCVELKKFSSLTGLAKLQKCVFFPFSQEHFVHTVG